MSRYPDPDGFVPDPADYDDDPVDVDPLTSRACLCGVVAHDGAVAECPVHEVEVEMDSPVTAECRTCGATVGIVNARQDEHVHQYGDKRCTGSGQERTDVPRAQAPDAAQEAVRAAAGFPWCDTCHAPAVGGDQPPVHATLAVDARGQIHALPIWGAQTHPVTMAQWGAAA